VAGVRNKKRRTFLRGDANKGREVSQRLFEVWRLHDWLPDRGAAGILARESLDSSTRGWARSIVVGKTYSTDDPEGLSLWEKLSDASVLSQIRKQLDLPGIAEEQHRYGEPTLIVPRLGQGAFRIVVTDAYGRRCAVSGGKVLPALDAAHIKPYVLGGTHDISNGLLLRRDIHSLFDIGYVTVDDNYRFVVSEKVKTEYNNGEEYRRLHGARLSLPDLTVNRPDRQLLQWHNDHVFRS
jgi:putative restriction endonuclease